MNFKNLNKKTLLFISPRLPINKLSTGGLSVIRKIFEHYASLFNLVIISRYDPCELKYIPEIKSKCTEFKFIPKYQSTIGIIVKFQKIISYIKFYYYSCLFLRTKGIDIVQFEWIEAKFFVSVPKNIKCIVDTHDIRFELLRRKMLLSINFYQKLNNYIKYQVVKIIEINSLKKSEIILVKSKFDKNILDRYVKNKEKFILSCSLKDELIIEKWNIKHTENVILFVGELNRDENHRSITYFIKYIWPMFIAKYPEYQLRIVGANPRDSLIKVCSYYNNIFILGYVDNIVEEYKKSRISIAPLLIGGGIIIKILDSLTFGIPTVTSLYGNQGINAVHKKHIMLAENPDEYLDCMSELIESKNLSKSISNNARNFVQQKFNFKNELSNILEYLNLIFNKD